MKLTAILITGGLLAGYCCLLRKAKTKRQLLYFACTAAALFVAISSIDSVPFYWSASSLIGKIVAAFLAFLIPFGAAAIMYWHARKRWTNTTATILAFLMSIIMCPVAIFAAVVLTCGFTGDCL